MIKYKLLWSYNSIFGISVSYILLLEDSIINKRFLSPEIYHTRINFFNKSGMKMEFEKRKKPYQIPDNAINSVDIDFCVCGFFFNGQHSKSDPYGIYISLDAFWASQVVLVVKNLPANAGDIRDTGSIPGSRRSPGGGHGNPLQYSCLENPMDRGAWWGTVHEATKSQTLWKQLSTQPGHILKSHAAFSI